MSGPAERTDASVWDDARPLPSAELRETVRADVCVIGLGGAGLSALAELRALGIDAVGLDAGAIGGGAAGRNAGFLIAGLADFFDVTVARLGGPLAVSLYRHTVNEINRLATEFPAEVKRSGSLRIAADEDEIPACEAHLQSLCEHGFAAERYAGPEGVGLLVPTDASYHPLRCLQREAAGLAAYGVKLFEHSPVVAIRPGEVTVQRGCVQCRTIIVAVDGGLEILLPQLKSRVRTARLQMLATAPAHDVNFPRPVYWRHGFEYWQQLPGGEIALGGFRDRGGESEWTAQPFPGGTVQALLEDFLRRRIRTAAAITRRWAGCVAFTPNRLPILEPVDERIFAVGAYSGTGNVLSRLCGRAVAQLAAGRKSAWAELLRL